MSERGLSLPQDDAFQRRDWRAQHAGAWAFGAVLVAAAAGLFGGEPLGRAHTDAEGLQVEYDRFLRRTARSTILLKLDGVVSGGTTTTVELTGDYFSESEPPAIRPLPARQTALADGVRLEFLVSDEGAVDIRVQLRPSGSGWREGEVNVNGHAVRVSGFVYP
jgi:hypothetical protein